MMNRRDFLQQGGVLPLVGVTNVQRVARGRSGVFDVTAFGADPTGAQQSSAAIQAAIDAATGAGCVWLPPGTYNLGTTGLTINGACPMVGAGAGGTTLQYRGTGAAVHINSGGGVVTERIKIGDFTIDCDHSGAVGVRLGQTSVSPLSANIVLERIHARGATHACYLFSAAQIVEVYSCWSSASTGVGFWLEAAKPSGNTTVSLYSCRARACGVGLLVDQCSTLTVYDFVSEMNQREGVKIQKTNAVTLRGITFHNLHLERNNQDGAAGRGDFYSSAQSALHDVTVYGLHASGWGSDYAVLLDRGIHALDIAQIAPSTAAIGISASGGNRVTIRTQENADDLIKLLGGGASVSVQQFGEYQRPWALWTNDNGAMRAQIVTRDGTAGAVVAFPNLGTTPPNVSGGIYMDSGFIKVTP